MILLPEIKGALPVFCAKNPVSAFKCFLAGVTLEMAFRVVCL